MKPVLVSNARHTFDKNNDLLFTKKIDAFILVCVDCETELVILGIDILLGGEKTEKEAHMECPNCRKQSSVEWEEI